MDICKYDTNTVRGEEKESTVTEWLVVILYTRRYAERGRGGARMIIFLQLQLDRDFVLLSLQHH